MEGKENPLSELLYDEEHEFEKLVPQVKQIVKIKKDGTPVIVCDKRKLTQTELITCYLIGKFFAKKLKLTEKDSATNREISNYLKISLSIVSARVKDLRDNEILEQVTRGEHKVSTIHLESFLNKLLEKVGERQ